MQACGGASYHFLLGKSAGGRHLEGSAQAGPNRLFDRKATLTCCVLVHHWRLAELEHPLYRNAARDMCDSPKRSVVHQRVCRTFLSALQALQNLSACVDAHSSPFEDVLFLLRLVGQALACSRASSGARHAPWGYLDL